MNIARAVSVAIGRIAVPPAGSALASSRRGQQAVERPDLVAARRLGQHDPVGPAGHHRLEVVQGERRRQRD